MSRFTNLASTIANLAIEDIVLLLFILIEACLFLFILFRPGGLLIGGLRKSGLHSFLICLLALSILAIIALLHARDVLLAIDDEPPPLLEDDSSSTLADLLRRTTPTFDIAGVFHHQEARVHTRSNRHDEQRRPTSTYA